MPVSPAELSKNHLLATLSREQMEAIAPHFSCVALKRHMFLERPRMPIEKVYFPISGLGSVITVGSRARDQRAETSVFGRDGMCGQSVVLGSDRGLHEVFMQIPGRALCLPVALLRELVVAWPAFERLLLRYTLVQQIQTAYTALSTSQDRIQTRLARWLLMAHDRLEGDDLPLTHEFLSLMLSIRRAGVTVQMGSLRALGLIRTARGMVTILDRDGLVTLASGAYGVPEAEYERLIGRPIKVQSTGSTRLTPVERPHALQSGKPMTLSGDSTIDHGASI